MEDHSYFWETFDDIEVAHEVIVLMYKATKSCKKVENMCANM